MRAAVLNITSREAGCNRCSLPGIVDDTIGCFAEDVSHDVPLFSRRINWPEEDQVGGFSWEGKGVGAKVAHDSERACFLELHSHGALPGDAEPDHVVLQMSVGVLGDRPIIAPCSYRHTQCSASRYDEFLLPSIVRRGNDDAVLRSSVGASQDVKDIAGFVNGGWYAGGSIDHVSFKWIIKISEICGSLTGKEIGR